MQAKSRILVAMSGGVDSSVTAALLKEAGHDVVGAFMRNGVSHKPKDDCAPKPNKQGCCSVQDSDDARSVASALGVPFYAINLEQEFTKIIDYFVAEYRRGRTPNPCVVCNNDLKFGRLLELADDIGASAVATGHYARTERRDGRVALLRGADRAKDQSYYLYGLSQDQLARCKFPLGGMTKPGVRALAGRFGLRTRDKPESMEVCFVPTNDHRDVLRERAPGAFYDGEIVDTAGTRRGSHTGAVGYTVGQRRGLGIGGLTEPLYVTAVDTMENTVTVGPRDSLLRSEFVVERPNFVSIPPVAAGATFRATVQVRYRSAARPGEARVLADGSLWVSLDEPEFAITPGQACVLYGEDCPDTVLCGGWIG